MPDPTTFEERLETVLHAYAERVPTDVDPVAIVRSTGGPPSAAALPWRRLSHAIAFPAVVVLAVAIGAAIVGVTIRSRSSVAPAGTASDQGVGNGLIAYANGSDDWRTAYDLWVLDPASDHPPRRLTGGRSIDLLPSWSPDGMHLAYWSIDASSATGGTATPSLDEAVVAGDASLMVFDARAGYPWSFHDMHMESRAIVSGVRLDAPYHVAPAWSPNSRSLAYSHLEDGTSVIDVVPMDGYEPFRVVAGRSPSWSPTGDRIAYRSDGQDDSEAGVWSVAVDGSDRRRVSAASGSGWAFTAPRWSPDGGSVTYYAGPDGSHDVWIAAADGSQETPIGSAPEDEYWPAFSPDGLRVAFERNVTPGAVEYNFVVADPDGSDAVVLESTPLWAGSTAIWAPDGTALLGYRGLPDGGSDLILVDPTDQTEAQVIQRIDDADSVDLAWQPILPGWCPAAVAVASGRPCS